MAELRNCGTAELSGRPAGGKIRQFGNSAKRPWLPTRQLRADNQVMKSWRNCGIAELRNCPGARREGKFGNSAIRQFGNGLVLLLLAFAIVLPLLAAKEYAAPRAYHAKTYPARDEHPDEKVTIAADPYDMADKAAIFSLSYKENGYLPIYLIISNDADTPLSLAKMKVELVTANRAKIQPAGEDDLYRRFSRIKRRGDEPSRLPIPLPRKAEAGVGKAGVQEIQNAPFRAKAVEPHATQAGFLFFDVSGISQPLAGAHLYVTGVRDANAAELMFFDIPMEKYLTYRPLTK